MGVFTRVKAIVTSSVNNALDAIESPEAEVDQIVRDMEKGCLEVKRNAATAIANVKMIERQLENTTTQQAQWQKNAEKAVTDGNDEIARKALEKRTVLDQRVDLLTVQLGDAKSLSENLKSEFKSLEQKVDSIKIKRDTLIAKKRAADAKKKMFDTSKEMNNLTASLDMSGNCDKISRFEDTIAKQLAEIEAMEELSSDDSLEKEFGRFEADSKLDDELAALKQNIK